MSEAKPKTTQARSKQSSKTAATKTVEQDTQVPAAQTESNSVDDLSSQDNAQVEEAKQEEVPQEQAEVETQPEPEPKPKPETDVKESAKASQTKEKADESSKTDVSPDDAIEKPAPESLLSDMFDIQGGFVAHSVSDNGFYRCGIFFMRDLPTMVLVSNQTLEPDSDLLHSYKKVATEKTETVQIVFVSADEARRIHCEPNLKIEDLTIDEINAQFEVKG